MKKTVNLELSLQVDITGTKELAIEYPVYIDTILDENVYLDELEDPEFESLKDNLIENVNTYDLEVFLKNSKFIDEDYVINDIYVVDVKNVDTVIKNLISENFFNVLLPEPKYLFNYKEFTIMENFDKTVYTIYKEAEIVHTCKTIGEVFDFLKDSEVNIEKFNVNTNEF